MSTEADGGRAIPSGVERAIEEQRVQLMRASTALTCLWITTLYQEWHDVEVDAADIALIVRRMIEDAVDALDSAVLARAAEEPDDDMEPDKDVEPDDDVSDDD